MKEKDSKFTQYLLDCGIRSGWHDKEIDEFTNDPRALETVMQLSLIHISEPTRH